MPDSIQSCLVERIDSTARWEAVKDELVFSLMDDVNFILICCVKVPYNQKNLASRCTF